MPNFTSLKANIQVIESTRMFNNALFVIASGAKQSQPPYKIVSSLTLLAMTIELLNNLRDYSFEYYKVEKPCGQSIGLLRKAINKTKLGIRLGVD